MNARHDRSSKLLLGFGLILLVLLGETFVAHQRMPSAASPYVWSALGIGSLACFIGAAVLRSRARTSPPDRA
jgi:hypothetical protein